MLPGLATRPTSVAPPPPSLSLRALGMFSQASGFMWPCAVTSTSFSDDPLRLFDADDVACGWVFLDDGRTLAAPSGAEGLSLPCIASSSFFNLQIEIKDKFNFNCMTDTFSLIMSSPVCDGLLRFISACVTCWALDNQLPAESLHHIFFKHQPCVFHKAPWSYNFNWYWNL